MSSHPYFITRIACPCCGSKSFEIIYQNPYDQSPIKDYLERFYSPQGGVEFEYLKGAIYCLCQCALCDSIFQKDIPNDFLMERLYEHWLNPQIAYSQNQKGDWLDFHLQYAQEIMQILAYFKKPSSSLNVFDFGMGWGKWSLMAKAFGCNSYGTELSQHRINNAVSNGINVITWDEIPQHKFDFINTEQVFEHLAEPLKTMEHLKQALKPNGLLKISVPTATDMERRLKIMDWMSPKGAKNSLNPVAPLEHINFYRRKSLLKMASAAGLKEAPLSIRLQYQYALDLSGFKKFVKSMIRPINRTVFKTQNYVFFCKE